MLRPKGYPFCDGPNSFLASLAKIVYKSSHRTAITDHGSNHWVNALVELLTSPTKKTRHLRKLTDISRPNDIANECYISHSRYH